MAQIARNDMYVIGITGGVGAGKSAVLDLLAEECKCAIYRADDIANEIKLKGNSCYEKIVDILGEEVLDPDGEINKRMMALVIFSDPEKKRLVEAVLHPAVKNYIIDKIAECKRDGSLDYFFFEAALLIEAGYKQICDEIWYVYASIPTRSKRLMASRNYNLDRIESIMDTQLSDREFRKNCEYVIDNDGDLENTRASIRSVLSK